MRCVERTLLFGPAFGQSSSLSPPSSDAWARRLYVFSVLSQVGTSRCDVPARVQRAERIARDVRTRPTLRRYYAARTPQRGVPTTLTTYRRKTLRSDEHPRTVCGESVKMRRRRFFRVVRIKFLQMQYMQMITPYLFLFTLTDALIAQTPSATHDDFYKRGTPTFVVGTAGDDRADRAIKAQVAMIRDLLFPTANIIDDSAVDVPKGPAAWPAHPILYGGPHVNVVLAKLGVSLPFRMERGKLTVGEQVFEGNEYRLIVLIPARAADKDGPGYPEFLLYAGNGSPGVTEINGVRHGSEPILIADVFGRLLAGSWRKTSEGTVAPVFTQPRARRIAWRTVDRELKMKSSAKAMNVHVQFPQQLPAARDEEQVIQACLRGLARAADKLAVISSADLSVYVYPDLSSIASLTGQRGDGHAVVEARVLHVVRYNPAADGGFEKLLTHEGTHALAYDTWGAVGTPLLGEGLAVWTAGVYGGVSLADWKRLVPQPVPPVADLLGKSFRQMPESQSYPLAGLFVEMAVEKLGLEKVRQRLYGATASTWESACQEAGTTRSRVGGGFSDSAQPSVVGPWPQRGCVRGTRVHSASINQVGSEVWNLA